MDDTINLYMVKIGYQYSWTLYVVKAPDPDTARRLAWERYTTNNHPWANDRIELDLDEDLIVVSVTTPDGVLWEDYIGE